MQSRALLILCGLQLFVNGALAQLSPGAEKALQAAYAGNSSALLETVQAINDAPFPTDGHRTIALVQAYASSENAKHIAEARRIAESYIAESAPGWIRDFVRIQLSTVLNLEGNRKDGSLLAEEILSEIDLESFAVVDDPFLHFIVRRIRISPEQIPTYLKDNLHLQIGSYYLNRRTDEGGADLRKAAKHFASIVARGIRESAMADQRLKSLDVSTLNMSASERDLPLERVDNLGSSAPSLVAHNDLPAQSNKHPTRPQSKEPKQVLQNGEPASSPKWRIIAVFFVAASCVLWLLVKNRK